MRICETAQQSSLCVREGWCPSVLVGGSNTRTGRLDLSCLGPAWCPCVARGGTVTAADVPCGSRGGATEAIPSVPRLRDVPGFSLCRDFLCAVSHLGMALFTTSLKTKQKTKHIHTQKQKQKQEMSLTSFLQKTNGKLRVKRAARILKAIMDKSTDLILAEKQEYLDKLPCLLNSSIFRKS